jgi:hypothetical protein
VLGDGVDHLRALADVPDGVVAVEGGGDLVVDPIGVGGEQDLGHGPAP